MTIRLVVNYNYRLFKEKSLVFAQRERLNILCVAITLLSFVVTFFFPDNASLFRGII